VSVDTSTIQRPSQYLREVVMYENVVKVNRMLRVTPSHPYIDAKSGNDFCKVRRHLRGAIIEMAWMVEMKPGRALVR
jgi:hypothetical protein